MSLSPDQLVDFGLLSTAQLEICQTQQRQQLQSSGRTNTLIELAIRNRFVSRSQVAEVSETPAGDPAATLLPTDVCLRYQVSPLRAEAGVLHIRAARRLSPHVQQSLINACTEPVATSATEAFVQEVKSGGAGGVELQVVGNQVCAVAAGGRVKASWTRVL